MTNVRTSIARSVVARVFLVSPVLASLAVIAAEALIDLLAAVGALVILALIAGV
jgi:hypothetical protein